MKLETTNTDQKFLNVLYEMVMLGADDVDKSIDRAGVHLERWIGQSGDYIVIRTDEMIHTIYSQEFNQMYVAEQATK